MAIKILIRNNKFYLVGVSRGLTLKIDCSEKILRYNSNQEFIRNNANLYRKFLENDFIDAIDSLIKIYKFQRRRVFNGEIFAPLLLNKIRSIRRTRILNLYSIDSIVDKFNNLSDSFSESLGRNNLPEVTLSKVLHFCNPKSFWIIDSRVKTILDIWGYTGTFKGFGFLLKDIFSSSLFNDFQNYIFEVNNNNDTFLKIIDKILWFNREIEQ